MLCGACARGSRAQGKRETGVRPVRTRHCEYGVKVSILMESLDKTGKTDAFMMRYKPGNLPHNRYRMLIRITSF